MKLIVVRQVWSPLAAPRTHDIRQRALQPIKTNRGAARMTVR
jgi:hypothetical protein